METALTEYIENNKKQYGISYRESLDYLQELVNTLKKDYENLEEA